MSTERTGPRPATRHAVGIALVLLLAGFVALGVWQVERRTWKLALIERVEARVHAPAVDAPRRPDWATVTASEDEYRRVRLVGRFRDDRATRVQALTEYGSGYWLIVPLQRDDGDTVLVNRGFVAGGKDAGVRPAATREPAVVTGLLRITEPRGSWLQANVPADDRWYSRDVAAIARARGLDRVAPYFIDADAAPDAPGDAPIGGLTVIAFRNDHLVYAITWFVLASLCAVALRYLVVREG